MAILAAGVNRERYFHSTTSLKLIICASAPQSNGISLHLRTRAAETAKTKTLNRASASKIPRH